MGVVYHSNYLIWMEVGRVDYCRAVGFNYRDMESDGILLAVAEAACRYLSPARYDDEVTIATTVESANRRMMTFTYEMTRGDQKLATGFTKHVFLDRSLKPVRLPEKYLGYFGL